MYHSSKDTACQWLYHSSSLRGVLALNQNVNCHESMAWMTWMTTNMLSLCLSLVQLCTSLMLYFVPRVLQSETYQLL